MFYESAMELQRTKDLHLRVPMRRGADGDVSVDVMVVGVASHLILGCTRVTLEQFWDFGAQQLCGDSGPMAIRCWIEEMPPCHQ